MKLLRKEFRLCLHPAAILMPFLSALILTPNYPYAVTFFYTTLGIFFICLDGRENHDITYTMTLPVSRRQAVEGRILFACCLEMIQILLCALLLPVKHALPSAGPNAAGMEANLALPGEGFLVFSLFNLIFFPSYYRQINRVGVSFVKASVAVFVYILIAVSATHVLPFVRDQLDTADPAFLTEKALFLLGTLIVYVLSTWLAARISVRRFERLDLQL